MTLAILGALLVGTSMGLLGSGGAILCVPLLVYLVGHDEKQAIAESLAIVGIVAAVGALQAWRRREIDLRVAVLYAVPGVFGSTLGAWGSQWIPGALQLLLLAMVMLLVARLMARPPRAPETSTPTSPGVRHHAGAQGFGIGVLTGALGVGGGFLIVPALTLLRGIDLPVAIGTSLAVIAANSSAGLGKHLWSGSVAPDWNVVGIFAVAGVVGAALGTALGRRLSRHAVRRAFAVFLVLLSLFIVAQELSAFLRHH